MDATLDGLLNQYGQANYEMGRFVKEGKTWQDACKRALELRATIHDHVAAQYVRRDRLTPDEWDDPDATAPEIVTPAVPSYPVTVDIVGVEDRRNRAARQRTLHADAAGNVVEGAPDFEGDR